MVEVHCSNTSLRKHLAPSTLCQVGIQMHFNNDYQISLNEPRHLLKISAKRMGAYWKEGP